MDLDGDGCTDLLSGSWPGEIFLFRGLAGHAFAAPEMLKDKDGAIINIGGGVEERPDRITISGSVTFETVDGKRFANYHGKRIESTPDKLISTTGTASVVHPVDWDGDGDYDLIIGNIDGNVYLVPNEGTPKSYAFGKEKKLMAADQPVRVASRAGPCVADWDGDGDLDLLMGAEDGGVSLFRNTGSRKSPELAAAVPLLPAGREFNPPQAPREAQRGMRAKLCVVDWNGDGKLDLLVGDLVSRKPDLPEPTPEQKAEYERIRKELEPLEARFNELVEKLIGPKRVRTWEERDQVKKERLEVLDQIEALSSKLPPEEERHGWVWLFLRQ